MEAPKLPPSAQEGIKYFPRSSVCLRISRRGTCGEYQPSVTSDCRPVGELAYRGRERCGKGTRRGRGRKVNEYLREQVTNTRLLIFRLSFLILFRVRPKRSCWLRFGRNTFSKLLTLPLLLKKANPAAL